MSSMLLWVASAYGIAAAIDLVIVTWEKERRFGEGRSDFVGHVITALLWPVDVWFRIRGALEHRRTTPGDDVPNNGQERWAEALEAGYRTTLDRIRAAGDASQRGLVDPLLTGQARAVREAGQEKMALTARDGKEHSVAWTLSTSVMMAVQTVPATRESVAGWYTAEFKGYLGYVSTVVTPLLESSGADVFVHVIFGQDKGADGWQPWTSIAFLPARPGAISPLLPRTCCNAEERARYGL